MKLSKQFAKNGKQIRIFLLQRCLAKTLAHSCPNIIPRSGERAKKVNCYVAALDKQAKPYILVRKIGKTHIEGLEWDGIAKKYSKSIRLSLRRASGLRLKLIHYVGASELEYDGVFRFWLGHTSKLPYIVLFFQDSFDSLSRFLFNRRSQLEANRDRLLEYVVEEFAVSRIPFDSASVLTKMYKLKWYSHPAATSARVRTDYLLESLVATGDLVRTPTGDYTVAPLAFKSLSDLREARRRNCQALCLQLAIIFLTMGTLLAGLIQAGIVRSPPILIAECTPKQGAASACTLRWNLWPISSASSLLEGLRGRYSNQQ